MYFDCTIRKLRTGGRYICRGLVVPVLVNVGRKRRRRKKKGANLQLDATSHEQMMILFWSGEFLSGVIKTRIAQVEN